MKFTTTLVAVFAASAMAIAIAEPDCFHPGQICSKEKREALANADCFHPGQICSKNKRAAEAFAEALSGEVEARCESSECFAARIKTRELANLVALTVRHADPEAWVESLNLRSAEPDCFHPGQICSKEKREAIASADCFHPGQICSKLVRAAVAVRDATASAEPDCFQPGQICSKEKRDAEAKALADCFHPGQICSRAKRDALALNAAASSILAMYN